VLIEIKGTQFINKGAELMLHAIINKVKVLWPHAEICLAPDMNSPYLSRARICAYQKLNVRKNVIDLNGLFYFFPTFIRRYLKNTWGIVTEADVDIILDASGFLYGDQWSTLILRQTAIETKRMKRKKKHYIFMPQALGPFSNSQSKLAANSAFESATLVFAREEESFSHVKVCAPSANLYKAPDFTNLLSVMPIDLYKKYKGGVAFILNSKMISDKNESIQWRERYVLLTIEVIKSFINKGENVFLLNHEGKSDQLICDEVNKAFQYSLDIVAPTSSLDVKAIIGHSKVVFCSRYHGCVSALSQGVPCIGTSWSHKYENLFEEYGMKELIMPSNIQQEQIDMLVTDTLDNHDAISTKLMKYSIEYQNASEQMWVKLANAVK